MQIAHCCHLKPGDFVHTMGDTHVYSNHVEALKIQVCVCVSVEALKIQACVCVLSSTMEICKQRYTHTHSMYTATESH